MRIFAWLAPLVVVACGGSKRPIAEPPDTRQVLDPSDGVPGEENNYCCCKVAQDPARYQVIAVAACDGPDRTCLEITHCSR